MAGIGQPIAQPPAIVPITSPFTPGSDCFKPTYTIGPGSNDTFETTVGSINSFDTNIYATLAHGYTSSCYPPNYYYAVVNPPQIGGGYFSPGYCPSGFSTASGVFGGSLTTALCCPLSANISSTSSATANRFDFNCTYGQGTPTLVSSGQTLSSFDDVSSAYIYQVVRGFAVTYAASDQAVLASLTVASASTSTASSNSQTPAATGAGVASAPTATNTTLSVPSSNSRLLAGAKAGIGVGVGIVALLLVAGLVLFLRRRKKDPEPYRDPRNNITTFEKSELSGEGKSRAELDAAQAYEAYAKPQPQEMNGDHVRAELEGHWTGWEVPTNARTGLQA